MFTSSATPEFASSGWILCGYREAAAWDARRFASIARIVEEHQAALIEAWKSKRGMIISTIEVNIPETEAIFVSEDTLTTKLSDGRTISVPLAWYPRLVHGTVAERNNWRLIGGGQGIHWPHLDEDISVESLLAGRTSAESQRSLKRWLDGREAVANAKEAG